MKKTSFFNFRITATFVVFLVSAILHEYCVSVPLRIFKAYAFTGMALQVTKNGYYDTYAFIGMTLQVTKNGYCDAYPFIEWYCR
jgi:hypothetical protein